MMGAKQKFDFGRGMSAMDFCSICGNIPHSQIVCFACEIFFQI